EVNPEKRVGNAHGGEREGDWIADQQHHDQRHEHQRCDVRDQEGAHRLLPSGFVAWAAISAASASSPRARRMSSASSSSAVFTTIFSPGSGIRPIRNATRLISSEMPCTASSKNPTGTSRRAGQMISPPALDDTSPRPYASTNTVQ